MKLGSASVRVSGERITVLVTVVFVLMAVVAAVLGFVGFRTHVAQATVLDCLYYTWQLFVLGAKPLEDGGPFPWPLEVARLIAPAATLTAIAATLSLLMRKTWDNLKAALARGHAVVVGDGDTAVVLARRLREDGRRVVILRSMPIRLQGVTTVEADLREPQSLIRCGLTKAQVVFAVDEDGATNLVVASNAVKLLQERTETRRAAAVSVHVMVNDVTLCSALNASRLRAEPESSTHISFFHLDEVAAARLVAKHPPARMGERPPKVLISGLTPFGCALLVEISRWWEEESSDRLPVTVVDSANDALTVLTQIRNRFPSVDRACDIVFLHASVHDVSQSVPETVREHLALADDVYLCGNDEQKVLSYSLSSLWTVAQGARQIIVRADRQSGFGEVLKETGGNLFDDIGRRVRVFGVLENACWSEFLKEDLRERLAKAIHHNYVWERRSEGEEWESGPAMFPWNALQETYRMANRAQAERMGAALAKHGISVVPHDISTSPFSFTQEELEDLSIREHTEWMKERKRNGWRLGEVRDNEKKTHPSMIPWKDLSEAAKNKDREAVMAFPQALATAGYQLFRGAVNRSDKSGVSSVEETN